VRLLLYTDSPQVGGAEIALAYLLGALSPAIEAGVLASDARVGQTIAAARRGTPTLCVPKPVGSLDRRSLLAHVRQVRAFAPDIVHANQTWPGACAYAEAAGLLVPGVRVVAVYHLPLASAIPRAQALLRRVRERRVHARVAVGERVARMIERIVGLPRGSVGTVPNGVPAAPTEAAAPPRDGAPPRLAAPPVIGSLGRLSEQKGYDLLVRALADLPGATLVLVGDGPERPALERLAAELGVAERLLITGWKTDARACLATFDVFALPSRWEGMPLGILEAMHAGLPVLATDVGSVAEAVRDGESGYVVARDDADAVRARLRDLIADGALRERMGERGRALAREHFTDAAMARRYEAMYRGTLGLARLP
jgi:glycosyltransferase involved in cell wall biosynthesis